MVLTINLALLLESAVSCKIKDQFQPVNVNIHRKVMSLLIFPLKLISLRSYLKTAKFRYEIINYWKLDTLFTNHCENNGFYGLQMLTLWKTTIFQNITLCHGKTVFVELFLVSELHASADPMSIFVVEICRIVQV